MFNVKLIHKDTINIQDIETLKVFCSNFRDQINYSDVDWENNNRCLLFKLLKTDTFLSDNGGLLLVFDDDKLVLTSGYSKSDFHNDVFICGIRTITLPEYRHKLLVSTYCIPKQLEEVKKLNGKMVMFCFDKDKSVYRAFTNNKFNLFLKNKEQNFQNENAYKGLTPYEHTVYVNYTVQNVLYKYLDNDFQFDWETIKVNNV